MVGVMGWDGLFEDLEAQFDSLERLQLEAEVADRTRRERAGVELVERLVAHRGEPLTVRLVTGGAVSGVLQDIGHDWLALRDERHDRSSERTVVVATGAVTGLAGLGRRTGAAESARRYRLGYVLRGLSRDRLAVTVVDRSGESATGTIAVVGADHLDLAEHPAEDGPRREAVRAVRVVPFAALVTIAPAG